MPKPVLLAARVAITLYGRSIAAGETFEARPIDAAILLRKRQAVFAKSAQPIPQPLPEPPVQVKDQVAERPGRPRRKREYRRRDLVAEA